MCNLSSFFVNILSVLYKFSAGIPFLVHFLGILALFKNNGCVKNKII